MMSKTTLKKSVLMVRDGVEYDLRIAWYGNEMTIKSVDGQKRRVV